MAFPLAIVRCVKKYYGSLSNAWWGYHYQFRHIFVMVRANWSLFLCRSYCVLGDKLPVFVVVGFSEPARPHLVMKSSS